MSADKKTGFTNSIRSIPNIATENSVNDTPHVMTNDEKLSKLFAIKYDLEIGRVDENGDLIDFIHSDTSSPTGKDDIPLIDKINNTIYQLCNHTWFFDDIDVDCEKSMKIKYCEKCELNCRDW